MAPRACRRYARSRVRGASRPRHPRARRRAPAACLLPRRAPVHRMAAGIRNRNRSFGVEEAEPWKQEGGRRPRSGGPKRVEGDGCVGRRGHGAAGGHAAARLRGPRRLRRDRPSHGARGRAVGPPRTGRRGCPAAARRAGVRAVRDPVRQFLQQRRATVREPPALRDAAAAWHVRRRGVRRREPARRSDARGLRYAAAHGTASSRSATGR
mmetsp:Transcript_26546/g.82034  ORF Transcript_26546/g.82034 Transcript_26546/m.82034 type:complete len:210 (-) Transcript_26546:882-1511(-)